VCVCVGVVVNESIELHGTVYKSTLTTRNSAKADLVQFQSPSSDIDSGDF